MMMIIIISIRINIISISIISISIIIGLAKLSFLHASFEFEDELKKWVWYHALVDFRTNSKQSVHKH